MNKDKILYERALITCVVMLFVCIILKLFGVQWFNLDASIPLLNKIDEIVMNNSILSFIYSFLLVFTNTILVCMITIKKCSKRLVFLISLFVFVIIPIKTFIRINELSFLLDTLCPLIICISCDKNASITEYIIVFLLNIFYQRVSLFIRDSDLGISIYSVTTAVLLNLDYYIMLMVTYLYLKKGDSTLCSIFLAFGSSLRTKLWKKPTQSSRTCSDKEK